MNRPQDKSRLSPHSIGNRFGRLLWSVAYVLLFRPSPRNFHLWRNWLLRLFGASLHPSARVYPRARIWVPSNLEMGSFATISDDVDVYCVQRITLGERAIVSQYTYLCGATHDYEKPQRPLVPKPITIGRDVWIAADVFVGPGVTIGPNTVVGARSSVFGDLPANKVCFGTPARPIRDRENGRAGRDGPNGVDAKEEMAADTHVSA